MGSKLISIAIYTLQTSHTKKIGVGKVGKVGKLCNTHSQKLLYLNIYLMQQESLLVRTQRIWHHIRQLVVVAPKTLIPRNR